MVETCPKLIVVTAPSGSGKTTIVRHILKSFPQVSFSVSATNRPPREKEVDGKDYYFLSQQEFLAKVSRDEFVEWEEVYEGRYYGTLKSEIDRIRAEGKIVIFDIEVNGAQNIKKQFKDNAFCLFVAPPSYEELSSRLYSRATESEKDIERRLKRARIELAEMNSFDQILVNDDLEYSLKLAERIVEEHLSCNWKK